MEPFCVLFDIYGHIHTADLNAQSYFLAKTQFFVWTFSLYFKSDQLQCERNPKSLESEHLKCSEELQ